MTASFAAKSRGIAGNGGNIDAGGGGGGHDSSHVLWDLRLKRASQIFMSVL